jgi:hypothetical protein
MTIVGSVLIGTASKSLHDCECPPGRGLAAARLARPACLPARPAWQPQRRRAPAAACAQVPWVALLLPAARKK